MPLVESKYWVGTDKKLQYLEQQLKMQAEQNAANSAQGLEPFFDLEKLREEISDLVSALEMAPKNEKKQKEDEGKGGGKGVGENTKPPSPGWSCKEPKLH